MGADKTEGDGAQQIITEETPVYRDPVDRTAEPAEPVDLIDAAPLIDPWIELTDAGDDDDDDESEEEAEVIDAIGWVEKEFPPDGPVAAPLDDPPSDLLTPTADLLPPPPSPPRLRVPSMRAKLFDELDPSQYQQEVRQLLNQPVVVQRKTPARKASSLGKREVTPPPKAKASAKSPLEKTPARPPARQYPKMLALLQDAEVPYGIEPKAAPPPPPVPGTFFPAPRAPLVPRPATADLDELLAAMAEGLLIGESPDGGTEVRVTLRDEFFAGTELRIRVGDGQVSAELHPPDRDIYWQLNGNLDELRERLAGRGLVVRELVVLDPNER